MLGSYQLSDLKMGLRVINRVNLEYLFLIKMVTCNSVYIFMHAYRSTYIHVGMHVPFRAICIHAHVKKALTRLINRCPLFMTHKEKIFEEERCALTTEQNFEVACWPKAIYLLISYAPYM